MNDIQQWKSILSSLRSPDPDIRQPAESFVNSAIEKNIFDFMMILINIMTASISDEIKMIVFTLISYAVKKIKNSPELIQRWVSNEQSNLRNSVHALLNCALSQSVEVTSNLSAQSLACLISIESNYFPNSLEQIIQYINTSDNVNFRIGILKTMNELLNLTEFSLNMLKEPFFTVYHSIFQTSIVLISTPQIPIQAKILSSLIVSSLLSFIPSLIQSVDQVNEFLHSIMPAFSISSPILFQKLHQILISLIKAQYPHSPDFFPIILSYIKNSIVLNNEYRIIAINFIEDLSKLEMELTKPFISTNFGRTSKTIQYNSCHLCDYLAKLFLPTLFDSLCCIEDNMCQIPYESQDNMVSDATYVALYYLRQASPVLTFSYTVDKSNSDDGFSYTDWKKSYAMISLILATIAYINIEERNYTKEDNPRASNETYFVDDSTDVYNKVVLKNFDVIASLVLFPDKIPLRLYERSLYTIMVIVKQFPYIFDQVSNDQESIFSIDKLFIIVNTLNEKSHPIIFKRMVQLIEFSIRALDQSQIEPYITVLFNKLMFFQNLPRLPELDETVRIETAIFKAIAKLIEKIPAHKSDSLISLLQSIIQMVPNSFSIGNEGLRFSIISGLSLSLYSFLSKVVREQISIMFLQYEIPIGVTLCDIIENPLTSYNLDALDALKMFVEAFPVKSKIRMLRIAQLEDGNETIATDIDTQNQLNILYARIILDVVNGFDTQNSEIIKAVALVIGRIYCHMNYELLSDYTHKLFQNILNMIQNTSSKAIFPSLIFAISEIAKNIPYEETSIDVNIYKAPVDALLNHFSTVSVNLINPSQDEFGLSLFSGLAQLHNTYASVFRIKHGPQEKNEMRRFRDFIKRIIKIGIDQFQLQFHILMLSTIQEYAETTSEESNALLNSKVILQYLKKISCIQSDRVLMMKICHDDICPNLKSMTEKIINYIQNCS